MIKLTNVTKRFKNKIVINNLNLKINEGEIIALVGPNGSGKTTLFNLILENIKAEKGEIEVMVDGRSLKNKIDKLSVIGFLQDESVLTTYLSGYDHLKFLANIYSKKEEEINNVISFLVWSNL